MTKKPSTIENRVYLFRDLASAWLVENGSMLAEEGATRSRALRALADIAYVSCVVADTERDDPDGVAKSVEERGA